MSASGGGTTRGRDSGGRLGGWAARPHRLPWAARNFGKRPPDWIVTFSRHPLDRDYFSCSALQFSNNPLIRIAIIYIYNPKICI